jgi:hypothetical protein
LRVLVASTSPGLNKLQPPNPFVYPDFTQELPRRNPFADLTPVRTLLAGAAWFVPLTRGVCLDHSTQRQQKSKAAQKEDTMTPQQGREQAADKNAIRPFHVNVPEAELTELRRRINATRWPERETVTDQSQGVQLGTVQNLARYWEKEYDWRRCEAQLNALPHSSPRSMGWTFTSFTFVRSMKMRCRSSSRTAGPARSSSS